MADAAPATTPAPPATPPPVEPNAPQAQGAAPAAPKGIPDAPGSTPGGAKPWTPIEIDDDEPGADGKPRKIRYETEHEFRMAHKKLRGADKRFDEAAALRTKADQAIKDRAAFDEMLKTNPAQAIRDYAKKLGIDPNVLRQSFSGELQREDEFSKLSPEDQAIVREFEAQQEELRQYKAREKEAATAAEQQEFQTKIRENNKRFLAELDAGTENFKGRFPDDFIEEKIKPILGDVFLDAKSKGYQITPQQAGVEADRIINTFVSSSLKSMTDEGLEKALGPERLTALMRRRLAASRKTPPTPARPAASAASEPLPDDRELLNRAMGRVPFAR